METPQASSEKLDYSVLMVIVIGTFMAILDGTIVNVGLPRIITIFNSSTEQAQWVVTAYMLTLGVIMPISGYLGDRFGYKKVYFFALAFFVLGSGLCGTAWSINSLIIFRVIQALGGGIMQPLGMAILYQNYPRDKMGMVLGIWGIAVMAAPAVGPTLGGYLVDYANWRFIFYLNVPVGIINLFLATMYLKPTVLIKAKHFDVAGIVFSSTGFFCLLLALSQGASHGWKSPYIVGLFFIAVLSLCIFVYSELNHSEPLLDLRLFRNPIFTISVIVSSIISIGMFGVIFLIPLLLQSILGQSAMQTGLILFPAALASGLMMPISGRLFDKYGARAIVAGGLVILVWTTYMMHTFNAFTSFAVMTLWLAIRGLGMGFCFMPSTTAGMNTVPQALVGRASALNNVIRQVASAFGIAMFTSVLQNRQAFHFANLASTINLNSYEYSSWQQLFQSIASALGLGYGSIQGISTGMIAQQAARQSMIMAMDDCFLAAAGMCLIALMLSFFFKGARR
ncbi:MAG TPA: DHA2 family efflux MFS transporter permease subunit [Syntrophomonadaceae bacterium]|nr:DHA2 family efflux MFS transporter permease subunit [Syntrophomonadaceae bacterium]